MMTSRILNYKLLKLNEAMLPITFLRMNFSNKIDVSKTAVPDILFNSLKNATSSKHIFENVSRHHSVMNSKHIMQALRSLFLLQKEGRSEISINKLVQHRDFEKLCHILKKKSGVIDIHETIEALKIITYVRIPSDSMIIQVLLQLIRHNINSLSLPNIMFLDFLLGHYKSTPLVDALKISLPLVFEINLPQKMDRDNVNSLAEYLFFVSRHKMSQNTIDLILDGLTNCPQNCSVKIAKSIVWSLSDLNVTPEFAPLLKKYIDEIVLNFDELTHTDLESTLSKLSVAYSNENPYFYSKVFCDTYINYIIDKNMGYEQAIYAMRKLKKLNHINKHLVDYISDKIKEDPFRLSTTEIFDIYNLAVYISRQYNQTENWDHLKSTLGELPINDNPKGVNLLKLSSALCSINIYKENLLKKCLSDHLDIKISRRPSLLHPYLTIYHCLRLYRPFLLELIPNNLSPDKLIQYFPPVDFPLEGALQRAYGGENYVKSGFYSKEGHQIDHVILFREGWHPVSFTPNSKFIEDINVDCLEKVLILNLKSSMYLRDSSHFKINVNLAIQVLEDMKFIVVPISYEIWDKLLEHEKIPYLVQTINAKLDTVYLLKNRLN